MLTSYGEKLNPARPLQEYPRPQMQRDSYICLNGRWQVAFTKEDGFPTRWEGEIVVPFSPESLLSGVGRVLLPDEILWYRRTVRFPHGFLQKRLFLHFGAIDQCCVVYWNGEIVGQHDGGYLPFSCEITRFFSGDENELLVKVIDETEQAPYMRGRQNLTPGPEWRSPMSGIWQTVWLESTPNSYISALRITPLYDDQAVEITVSSDGPITDGLISIYAMSTQVAKRAFVSGVPVVIELPGALSWHPRNPFLYNIDVTLAKDNVKSYFGMRKFSMEPDEEGIPRLMLNNKPFFLRAILDEGIYSDGLYTPPSDAAMKDSLSFVKQCGFNTVRKYGKIEPLRWYYHCDKMGILVWQDIPGGGDIPKQSLLGGLFKGTQKDTNYRRFGRENPDGRTSFLRDVKAIAATLYNSTALAIYTLFDEGYGQFDSAQLVGLFKIWDSTRLIDHAGGWHDQLAGDFLSVHALGAEAPPTRQPGQTDSRAYILSACGGFGVVPQGVRFLQLKPQGPYLLERDQPLEEALENLWTKTLVRMAERGLAGFCYYRLADVDNEVSGLVSADYKEQKIKPKILEILNGQLP